MAATSHSKLSVESANELEALRAAIRYEFDLREWEAACGAWEDESSPKPVGSKPWITGWRDEDWGDYHVSETQGVEVDDEARSLQGYAEWDARLLAFAHRDPDESSILRRWGLDEGEWTNEVLDEVQRIEDEDDRAVWTERMTAFREAQLRRLAKRYFGTPRYMRKEIVLRWEQASDGRWKPVEKMVFSDWVASRVEDKGSRLGGFASCCGTLRQKIARLEKAGKLKPDVEMPDAPVFTKPLVRKSYAEAKAGRNELLAKLDAKTGYDALHSTPGGAGDGWGKWGLD